MLKRLLLATAVLIVVVSVGLYFWAHAIFASDPVRRTVEAQLTTALGQPVRIGGIGATVFPRVTIALRDVRIGEPARITATRLDLGTALGALLSRRIEQGSVRLVGARVELPLPAFTSSSTDASADAGTAAPVEIVSVDEIVLEGAEIVSGGRTLRGDIELGVTGKRLDLRRVDLNADGAPLSVTGRIDDPAGPTGQLAIRAATLDILRLASFAGDFSSAGVSTGNPPSTASTPSAPAAVPMQLEISIETERAMLGTLRLDGLRGTARVTDQALTLDPITFGTFSGQAKGALSLSLAETPTFAVNASLSGVDLAELMAFVGQSGLLTGRFGARLDVTGRGVSPDAVLRSTTGTARIDATDGSVKGLGLVRAVVLAGSMRADSQAQAAGGSSVEPFSRMGATLALGGGRAATRDLRFESKDLLLDATGSFGLDGSNVDLAGKVQLSDALTAQAGRDLVRYTAEQGRVTLPASITGSAAALRVRIDTGAVMKRAITNRANEEIKKGLGRIFGR
jgi:uncharacterized protein involved in outer membrane biogenesis